jgi:hypothetical protein
MNWGDLCADLRSAFRELNTELRGARTRGIWRESRVSTRSALRCAYRFASQFANWKIVMTITTTITMNTIVTT